jgi:hypothetical protein
MPDFSDSGRGELTHLKSAMVGLAFSVLYCWPRVRAEMARANSKVRAIVNFMGSSYLVSDKATNPQSRPGSEKSCRNG